MIHFQCPTCGALFDVADNLDGRTARCKKCGGRMKIPSPAAAAAARAVAVAGAAAGLRPTPIEKAATPRPWPSLAGRPINWRDAVTSQVALAPITAEGLRGIRPKPSPLDEPSIPGPYKLATAPSLPVVFAQRGKAAGSVTRGYRGAMGKVQKLFRWLNESAYLVSVPFIMCLLLGLAVGNHSLMVMGATVVVLLNLGRIVAGVANLVVIPFRESPIQGILFLIPPITFFYLYQNWHKVHRPVKRIIGPILTMLLVAATFLLEPALQAARTTKGSVQERAQAGAGTLKKGVREHVGKVQNVDLTIEGRLQDAKRAIESQAPAAKPN